MKYKIRLNTMSDIKNFVNIASGIDDDIQVSDGNKLTVNAKSMLGVMYSWSEWDKMILCSNNDYYSKFEKFIID